MAKGLRDMSILAVIMVTMLMRSLAAQTVHLVGNEFGWRVPTGYPLAYAAWVSTQNFTVGDILMFSFTTGLHDVAQVTDEAFHSCNKTIPFVSLESSGPVNITLNTVGEIYFFCTFSNHCELGQKLAINVTEAAAPGPPAAAPPPSSPQAPNPSRGPIKYIVGDDLGWKIPGVNPLYYVAWPYKKTFLVGDSLEFNFVEGSNDVAEVSATEFADCSTTVVANYTKSPAVITLTTMGPHFYRCSILNNCNKGQRLAINVTSTATIATPPSASVPPPHTPIAPTPSKNGTDGQIAPTPSKNGTDGSHAPRPSVVAAGFSMTLLLSGAIAYLMF